MYYLLLSKSNHLPYPDCQSRTYQQAQIGASRKKRSQIGFIKNLNFPLSENLSFQSDRACSHADATNQHDTNAVYYYYFFFY